MRNLRILPVGVAIEENIDPTPAGGRDEGVLVSKVDADDGHWLLG